ncbi:tetratricopeptide repeat protein [Pseudomonas shirazensis]
MITLKSDLFAYKYNEKGIFVNGYNSLGDLYLEKGDKTKAIETFKKALTLKVIPETKEKLEKLLKEKK